VAKPRLAGISGESVRNYLIRLESEREGRGGAHSPRGSFRFRAAAPPPMTLAVALVALALSAKIVFACTRGQIRDENKAVAASSSDLKLVGYFRARATGRRLKVREVSLQNS